MKLQSLTIEQKNRLKQIKNEYVKKAITFQEIDKQKSINAIGFVYSLIKKQMPKIYKVSSPFFAQKLANKLKGTEKIFYQFGTYLTIYWQSFYAFYDTFVEFGIIGDKFDKYQKLKQVTDTGIFSTIEFENAIIICEKPIICHKNENGMHCTTGPAIKWRDGYCQYYINGRKIDKQLFNKCLSGEVTQSEFLDEQNDERRSAMYMILGEEKIMNLLCAELVDETTVVHDNGEVEKIGFYKTKDKLNKFRNKPYAWRKVICPSTGTTYLTPTDPDLKTALDVAKFHRPSFVPKSTDYKWYSRS
jgi:hypothetical protein